MRGHQNHTYAGKQIRSIMLPVIEEENPNASSVSLHNEDEKRKKRKEEINSSKSQPQNIQPIQQVLFSSGVSFSSTNGVIISRNGVPQHSHTLNHQHRHPPAIGRYGPTV